MSWRDLASCRGRDDINWFPDPSDTRGLARAQLVCRDCPVKLECADHARNEPEFYGVWAGVRLGRELRVRPRPVAVRAAKTLSDDERGWLEENVG